MFLIQLLLSIRGMIDRDEHIEAGSRKSRSAFSTVIPEDSFKVLGDSLF